jgi:L-rhamnose mutarotase
LQIEDEAKWDAVASTEVCQRWWKVMAPLMETEPGSVRPKATALTEVFYLE